jgi:hypothetical protein
MRRAQIGRQPVQSARTVMSGLLQHLGRIETDEMDAAGVERIRSRPEMRVVFLFRRRIPTTS